MPQAAKKSPAKKSAERPAKRAGRRPGAKPAMTVAQLARFLSTEFPQGFHPHSGLVIEQVWHGGGRVRQAYQPQFIRPGGTISGPTMMALADFAMYVGVLASIGPVPLAVTTNLNINFLRRPAAADLVAECRLLKLGKRLAVGEVTIRSDGTDDPVAHVTATYSIPGST
jgi:uncharacterized protein (TIGR00369 family)